MADDRVEWEFVVKAEKALTDLEEFRGQVDQIKSQLKTVATETGESLRTIAASLKSSFAEAHLTGLVDPDEIANAKAMIQDYNRAMTAALRESSAEAKKHEGTLKDVDKELKQKPADVGGFTKALSSLGDVGKYVFGTVLGLSAVQALQQVVRWFGEAEKAGEEYSQTIFTLEASVRGLQQQGLDVSMKKTTEQIMALRKEYRMFTTNEIAGSIANIQFLTTNFGLNTEQMENMQKAAMTLSVIIGKDLNESARQMALFMSSGYAEGLQKAGLAANKMAVQLKAQELGFKGAYDSLTNHQRAVAAYEVILDELKGRMGEVQEFQKTDVGILREERARFEELKTMLGNSFVPALIAAYKALDFLVKFIYTGIAGLGLLFFQTFVTPFLVALDVINKYKAGLITSLASAVDETQKSIIKITNMVKDQFKENMTLKVGVQLSEDVPVVPKAAEVADYSADLEKMFQDILKLNQDYQDKVAKANQDFLSDYGTQTQGQLDQVFGVWNSFWQTHEGADYDQQKQALDSLQAFFGEFGKITQDALDKATEIWQKYWDKIADINTKEQQNIADENTKYQQDVADLHHDTEIKLQDAARKYHDAEIKAEREFQEKMRRLREEFLFDLEDALRERDALQVLRLIRRYKLDVEQAQRQYEQERQERLDAYRQEIEDIKRQAAEKEAQLKLEHERRLEEIQLQAERERQAAEEDRQKALDQLMVDLQKERDQRQEEYDAQLEQLKAELEKQLKELLLNYGIQLGSTATFGDAMTQLLAGYFGPGGSIDKIYGYLGGIIQQAVADAQAALDQILAMQAQAQAATAQMQSSTTPGYIDAGTGSSDTQPSTPASSNASGGALLATSPQVAMFGEVPELVTFTPISKLNTQSMTGTTAPSLPNGSQSNVHIVVDLSQDLEGRIVDKSLSEASGIFAEVMNQRR